MEEAVDDGLTCCRVSAMELDDHLGGEKEAIRLQIAKVKKQIKKRKRRKAELVPAECSGTLKA